MKKKMLCLACAAVMGLGMSTTAFAKVGSGDVDSSGVLTANDSAMILQYTLDRSFSGSAEMPMDKTEANYDGNLDSLSGDDLITANDAAFVLQDVLDPQTNVYLTVSAGKENPIKFSEIINKGQGTTVGAKTLALEFADSIFDGDYDSEINSRVDVVNNFVDRIEFTGEGGNKTSIRTDIGWSKFENAVSGIVTDQAALAELENSVKNKKYTSAADIKADYETAKKAFGPASASTGANLTATGDKVIAITGPDFVTLTKLDDNLNPIAGTEINLKDIVKLVADNNLQAYDTVTIDQITEVFGSKILVKAQNPNNGYSNQAIVTVERR